MTQIIAPSIFAADPAAHVFDDRLFSTFPTMSHLQIRTIQWSVITRYRQMI